MDKDEPDSAIEQAGDSQITRETEVVIEAISENPLMRLRALPTSVGLDKIAAPPTAFLAALRSLGEAAPALQIALREASANGQALQVILQRSAFEVVFRPDIMQQLSMGSLRLMQSATGPLATAIDSSGRIVANGRIVSSIASGASGGAAGAMASGAPLLTGGGGAAVGVAGGAAAVGGGITLGAVALVALPIVVAAGAAYVQQRRLDQTLGSIKDVVDRIEARLKDADTGVCDAADSFLDLAGDAMSEGGVTDYLRLELAVQRTAVEALYSARRRWVSRFKQDLEAEQIKREHEKGRGQPWVETVAEQSADGRLEEELILFVRSLVCRSRLALLTSAVLAEEGNARTAMELIEHTTTELRVEFFDLHRRLVPLARIAPDAGFLGKIPGMSNDLDRAHDSVHLLVEQLDRHVLPTIPLAEEQDEPIDITVPAQTVAVLTA
jgi:hypothetical protein